MGVSAQIASRQRRFCAQTGSHHAFGNRSSCRHLRPERHTRPGAPHRNRFTSSVIEPFSKEAAARGTAFAVHRLPARLPPARELSAVGVLAMSSSWRGRDEAKMRTAAAHVSAILGRDSLEEEIGRKRAARHRHGKSMDFCRSAVGCNGCGSARLVSDGMLFRHGLRTR